MRWTKILSRYEQEESNKDTFNAVARFSKDAQEDYDFIVLAAHGVEAWSDKSKTDVWFSDGLEKQENVRKQFRAKAVEAKAHAVFVSCYQDWKPRRKGEKRPTKAKEVVKHSFPRIDITSNRIEYIQYKIERQKYNGR